MDCRTGFTTCNCLTTMKFSQLFFATFPFLTTAARLGTPFKDEHEARILGKGKAGKGNYDYGVHVPPPLYPCDDIDMSWLGGDAGIIDSESFGVMLNAGVGAGIDVESACASVDSLCAAYAGFGSASSNGLLTGNVTGSDVDLLLLTACCSEIIQSLGPETNGEFNLGIALLLQGALSLGFSAGGYAGFGDMYIEVDPVRECALKASINVEGGNGGEVIATTELLAINVGAGIGYTEGNIDDNFGANIGAGAVLNAAVAVGDTSGGDAESEAVYIGNDDGPY